MSKLIEALTDFYNGKPVESFGGDKSKITHNTTWSKLERVFNEGHGRLAFATVDTDRVLLINDMLLTPIEKRSLSALKVPYELVFLGYPDYYHYGLSGIRQKRKQAAS